MSPSPGAPGALPRVSAPPSSSVASAVLARLATREVPPSRSEVLYDLHLYDDDPWGDGERRGGRAASGGPERPVPIYSGTRPSADAARRQMLLRPAAGGSPGAADLSGATRLRRAHLREHAPAALPRFPRVVSAPVLPPSPGPRSPPAPASPVSPVRRAQRSPGRSPRNLTVEIPSPASPAPGPPTAASTLSPFSPLAAPAPSPSSPAKQGFLDHFYHIHAVLLESAERAKLEAEERAAREARLEDMLIAKLQRKPKIDPGGDTYEDRMLARLMYKRAEARRAQQRPKQDEDEDPEKAAAAAKQKSRLRREWVWKLVEAIRSGDERAFLAVYDQAPPCFSREELKDMKAEARERSLGPAGPADFPPP